MTDAPADVAAAATERVQRSLEDLERLDMTALSRLSLSLRDVDARAPAREAAIRAAERAGLGPMLEAARAVARDYVSSAFDRAGFRTIGVDLAESRSRASVDDRVAVTLAAEDDVIGEIAAPFVSDEVRDVLTAPMDRLRPAWSIGDAPAPSTTEPGTAVVPRRWIEFGFVALVVASLVLIALGSGVGTFGLAAAIGIALVVLVVRERPSS